MSSNCLNSNLILVTGGARSGKSRFAQEYALKLGQPVVYIPTLQLDLNDSELVRRVARHQRERPSQWEVLESTTNLAGLVHTLGETSLVAIIDCLALHLANLMYVGEADVDDYYELDDGLKENCNQILAAIGHRSNVTFIVVTSEVGCGIVPNTKLGRAFRDFLGEVNQMFAQSAYEVWLCASGIPLRLKPQLNVVG